MMSEGAWGVERRQEGRQREHGVERRQEGRQRERRVERRQGGHRGYRQGSMGVERWQEGCQRVWECLGVPGGVGMMAKGAWAWNEGRKGDRGCAKVWRWAEVA